MKNRGISVKNPQVFLATLQIIIPMQNPINRALIMELDFNFFAFFKSSLSGNSNNFFYSLMFFVSSVALITANYINIRIAYIQFL